MLTEEQHALAYDYLDDIQSFLAGTLSEERLRQVLCSMANDGLAWDLTGPLRDAFDRMLRDGDIVGVIQNVWDDLNECVDPCCYEKVYHTREVAALIKEPIFPQGENAPHATVQKPEEESTRTLTPQPSVRAALDQADKPELHG